MPPVPQFYRPDPNASRTMLDLIMRQGEIQAQRAQNTGQIWGNVLGNVANIAQQWGARREEEQQRTRQSQAFEAAIQSGDPRAIIGVLGPRDGPAVITALRATTPDGMKQYTDRMELGRDLSRGVLAVPEDMRPRAYNFARQQALSSGAFKPEDLPEDFNEALPILNQVANYGREEPKPQGLITVAPGSTVIDPATRQPVLTAPALPKEEKPPTVGSFEDYVVRVAGERGLRPAQLSPRDIEAARKAYQQADDRPININTGQPRPLSQTAEANLLQNYSKEWERAAAPARTIERQVGIMEAGIEAARRGDRNAGAQAVIQTFNKILDPDSAVREGEYARSAAGQAMMDRIRGALEQVQSGGANMPLSQLETFANLAREMAAKQRAYLPAVQSRIGKKLDRYGLPHELIFDAPAGAPPAGGAAPPPPVVTTPEITATGPNGQRLVLRNGQWVAP